MKVTPTKQVGFIERILYMHGLATRRGAKASVSRLSLQEWQAEVNRSMLMLHVWEQMQGACDGQGGRLFSDDLMKKLRRNIIDGRPGC